MASYTAIRRPSGAQLSGPGMLNQEVDALRGRTQQTTADTVTETTAKLAEVTTLVQRLRIDLKERNLTPVGMVTT